MTQQSHPLHVVLGGTGGVGSAVVRELVAQGKRVRVVSRSGKGEVPTGVEVVKGDIQQLDQARALCRDASFVYMCANPAYHKWAEGFPPLMRSAIEGASANGAALAFADNLYMYPPASQPLTEDMPWQPITHKGKVRVQLDEMLLNKAAKQLREIW